MMPAEDPAASGCRGSITSGPAMSSKARARAGAADGIRQDRAGIRPLRPEENDIAGCGAHDVPALREVLGAEAAEVQQKKRSAREETQGNQNERRAGGERLPKPARWKMGQSRRSKSPSRKGTKLFSIMATQGSYCLAFACG